MTLVRHRGRLVAVLAVLLALAAGWWVARDSEEYGGDLDPRNPGPEGGQAVATVLADEGVDVTIARSAADLEEVAVDGDTARVGITAYAAVIDKRFLSRHTLWHLRGMLRFVRKHPERLLVLRGR